MIPIPAQQRFDDRLATILAIDPDNRNGANNLWVQLADLLAQGRDRLSGSDTERALAALSLLRDRVDLPVRQRGALAIAGRCRSAPLAVLLSGDHSSVICAFFDHVRLDDAEWLAVLPVIGPLARSRLRLRQPTLSPTVGRALDALAAGDLSLPTYQELDPPIIEALGVKAAPTEEADKDGHAASPEDAANVAAPIVRVVDTEAPQWDNGASSIADLVRRIDDWQRHRPANDGAPMAASPSDVRLSIDADGFIRRAEGIPNAAICGLSIAEPARPEQTGVDAGVARAFSRRAPISKGRLYLAPGLPWSGLWVLAATPQFDIASGRFLGYRGAIQPAAQGFEPDYQTATPSLQPLAEAMRQMVHELRSPLNAISGFSQLIDGQFFGPVTANYRSMVQAIRSDAGALLRVFDDLDVAARIDLGTGSAGQATSPSTVDLLAMVRGLVAERGDTSPIPVRCNGSDMLIAAVPEPLQLLLRRLIALATSSGTNQQPLIQLSVDPGGHMRRMDIVGITVVEDANGAAMPMGQEFSLRLIEQLAADAGVTLDFSEDKAILNFHRAVADPNRVGASSA